MKRFTAFGGWFLVQLYVVTGIGYAQEPADLKASGTVQILELRPVSTRNTFVPLESGTDSVSEVNSATDKPELMPETKDQSNNPASKTKMSTTTCADDCTSAKASSPSAISYTRGEGITISMLDGTSKLKIAARFSGLGIFSNRRPFTSGLPLFLLPATPFGESTSTFDLHGRQSTLLAQFTGPEFCGLTPSATILTLFLNDNLTSDNYGLLLYFAYGELKNDKMRFAAGLQEDILNPHGPTVLPVSLLYSSGNAGSYRGQVRYERYFRPSETFQTTLQVGISEPVATIVRGRLVDPLVEDNGWPNVEGRLAFFLGHEQELMGDRKQRPLELGVSGVIGQLRSTRIVGQPSRINRTVADVWALGGDLKAAVTDRLGMIGEVFVGQTLADYNAGILQNFNSDTFRAIRTSGGWFELYYYLHPKFHVHVGYGIDTALPRDLALGQATSNQTAFATFLYDFSKSFQIGFEVDYRKTNFISPALDVEGVIAYTQFLWRF